MDVRIPLVQLQRAAGAGALCIVVGIRLLEQAIGLGNVSLLAFMTGESYFRGDGLPWVGLLASAAVSAMMLYGAALNIARQDF